MNPNCAQMGHNDQGHAENCAQVGHNDREYLGNGAQRVITTKKRLQGRRSGHLDHHFGFPVSFRAEMEAAKVPQIALITVSPA